MGQADGTRQFTNADAVDSFFRYSRDAAVRIASLFAAAWSFVTFMRLLL